MGAIIRVGIVGVGKSGVNLLRKLRGVNIVDIAIVCDILDDAPGMILAEYEGIPTTNSLEELCSYQLDLIIETTGSEKTHNMVEQLKSPTTSVLATKGAQILFEFPDHKEKKYNYNRMNGLLEAVFNSVQEGIEMVGKDGIVQYVNPSFTRITGISAKDRLNKDIFDIAPDGSIARVLRTHEPLHAYRTKIAGCQLDFVANAFPIIVEGKIDSVLAVFHPLTQEYKILESLEASKQRIKELEYRIGQIPSSMDMCNFDDILGSHPEFRRVLNKAHRAAKMDGIILLSGESGTGKDLFAQAIHSESNRKNGPFIVAHCADTPSSLLEGELFGYEPDKNLGTEGIRLGRVEVAREGTLYLDEVGELNYSVQQQLINLLKTMEYEAVGGIQKHKANVRIVASTSRNLFDMVQKGSFSEELLNILRKYEISLLPLRKHKEDINTYVNSFIMKFNRKYGKKVVGLSRQAEKALAQYGWPGNVKELKNVIERAMAATEDDLLHDKHFANWLKSPQHVEEIRLDEPIALDVLEKKMIRLALQRYGDSVEGKKRAAQVLNISLATLYNKLKIM